MKFALLFLLASCAALAQKTDWALVKALPIGQEIRVSLDGGKSSRGQLQHVTDDSLILVAAHSQETLARPQVLKVATKGESHRVRNTLIGLGIGAGAGLAIGAGSDQSCSPHCFLGNNIAKAVFTPIGAIVGTVIGVAWPTGMWHEVYRSK